FRSVSALQSLKLLVRCEDFFMQLCDQFRFSRIPRISRLSSLSAYPWSNSDFLRVRCSMFRCWMFDVPLRGLVAALPRCVIRGQFAVKFLLLCLSSFSLLPLCSLCFLLFNFKAGALRDSRENSLKWPCGGRDLAAMVGSRLSECQR